MNQRILSSLVVTLLTTIGTATAGYAQQNQAVDQEIKAQSGTANLTSAQPTVAPPEVVKVGESQSRRIAAQQRDVIAKIQAYEFQGRQVATLYVRNIPVLTFLGSSIETSQSIKIGQIDPENYRQKTASNYQATEASLAKQPNGMANADSANDPVWRAATVASKLNQLNRDNVSASAIAVSWLPESKTYSIRINNQELVQINNQTILPDTTRNLAQDALQATNRLRRLMGNAPPLKEVAGMPVARAVPQIAIGPIRVQFTGMASWYGPGFNGNQSASGEIFNQNAMTAAHKTLPFGTRVRVTNLDNGRTTVVRINDRGPYAYGRVIDLSAAAARVLGLMQSGVAPVRVDVLGKPDSVATEYK
ncbi:MAG: septal ring lytic transglycosylase RlpA family protein [Coleofasciculaceae cyanobacterium]